MKFFRGRLIVTAFGDGAAARRKSRLTRSRCNAALQRDRNASGYFGQWGSAGEKTASCAEQEMAASSQTESRRILFDIIPLSI